MVGLVITIAQRKGGAGKTTLATQFAVTWARRGARVAALDIDPQGSFSAWVDLRRARLGAKAIGFDFAALPGWRAAREAPADGNNESGDDTPAGGELDQRDTASQPNVEAFHQRRFGPGGGHQQSSWALSPSSSIRVSGFLLFPFGLC